MSCGNLKNTKKLVGTCPKKLLSHFISGAQSIESLHDHERVESRRYAPDEERRLLALIEARDALVQEAVEKGLSDQLASIDSLNKQIRAFVFSRPSSAPLEVSHSHQAIPQLSESTLVNTTTVDNVAVDNSDSVQ